MAALSDYVTGTITLTTGEAEFTGAGTAWLLAGFKQGDTIIDVNGATEFMGVIASIADNTTGTLTKPWEGPTVTTEYRMRYLADGQRVTAQARNLIELLGNGRLTAIAAAPEPSGVIEMLPGGAARLVPLTDLVSGANYDVQVADMAARAAYDGQTAGFAVLVADTGDGRAAIFSKLSNASGDWSAAAYVTGETGGIPDIAAGTTITLAPGTPADVDIVPDGSGGYLVNFDIPAGEGFAFVPGGYNPATAYDKGDVVRDNNSSWIAVQATTGNAPPTLPTTANAYWELLAAKGADGAGTGDMIGPSSAIDNAIARFDGLTGKLLKSGAPIANADMVGMAYQTVKGRASPSTGAPEDVTMSQLLALLTGQGAYARSNILSTVGKSGGVPTGGVFERGSNANGYYVRFADGTQLAWFKDTTARNTTIDAGRAYISTGFTLTFPVAFIAAPIVAFSAHRDVTGNAGQLWAGSVASADVTTTTVLFSLFGAASTAVGGGAYMAFGRWE